MYSYCLFYNPEIPEGTPGWDSQWVLHVLLNVRARDVPWLQYDCNEAETPDQLRRYTAGANRRDPGATSDLTERNVAD
jgi:hypothetical protein